MNKYRASIILACHNKEKFLEKSIDSLINLSLFNEMEIIIVDDHSCDNSVAIIKEYQEKYSNIKLIELEFGSGGPSKPRNIGIEMAQARYVIFMDPDDVVINDGYSLLVEKIEELNSDILIATRIGVNSQGKEVWKDYIDYYPYINENNREIQKDLFSRRPFILKSIYSKDLILKNNIRFNEKISTSEDECFGMECVYYAKRITKINDIVYQYTVEASGSITTNISIKIYKQLYEVMLELERVHSKMFVQDVVYTRIVKLLRDFYAEKIVYMNNHSDVLKAFELIYDSCEKFGFDKLMNVNERKYYDFILNIKSKNFIDVYAISIENYRNKSQNVIKYITRTNILKQREIRKLKKRLKKRNFARKIFNKLRTIKKNVLTNKNTTQQNPEYNENLAIYEKLKSIESKCNGYWIFADRKDNANDNAEVLYRYVKDNNIHDKIAFIINEQSRDFTRLENEGFNMIKWGSFEHFLLLRDAQYFFTSHCDYLSLMPWSITLPDARMLNLKMPQQYKLVFLQHGVIRKDMSDWLGERKYYKFICSSEVEADSLVNIAGYRITQEQIILSGLARYDKLSINKQELEQKKILIFPTWRPELAFSREDDLEQKTLNSKFYQNWKSLFTSEKLINLAEKENIKITIVLHKSNDMVAEYIKNIVPEEIEFKVYDEIDSFSELVNNYSMIITDHSSFSFDFLYVKKPVVYFDFEENALENNLINMEYSKFGFCSSEVEEVINEIANIIKNNFEISKFYSKNIDELFKYRDHHNCERIMAHFK